jgi:hypothetical protein
VEEAGFVKDNDKTGRKVGSGPLMPPHWAMIDNGCVHWVAGPEREDFEDPYGPGYDGGVVPSLEAFDGFIRLWEKGDVEILAFVKKWGTLRRPFRHFQKIRKADNEAREPLSRWRALSHHAWELLEIAAVLRTKKEKTLEYWSNLMSIERALDDGDARTWAEHIRSLLHTESDLDPRGDGHPQLWRGAAEIYLRCELRAWSHQFGSPTFAFDWLRGDDPDVYLWDVMLDFGGSLLCFVGCQLGLVLVGGDLFICDGCGQPYLRKRVREDGKAYRMPKTGANNYCDGCGVRARNRIASQKARDKARKARTNEETRPIK